MTSYPDPEQVFEDLGDKAMEAFVQGAATTRSEYGEYRRLHPKWVAEATERGLANWIHDRLWSNYRALLDDHPDITWIDAEPTRELAVGSSYILRVKRHSRRDGVSTYPTQGALFFMDQEPTLPGLEVWRLIVGYRWQERERSIGEAVMSLRDGLDNVIWCLELPGEAQGGRGGPGSSMPPAPAPKQPSTPSVQVNAGIETGEEEASPA